MNLLDTITDFFSYTEEQTKNKAPEGLCSLCWGYEEYDGKIRKLFKDKQIDVNNHKVRYMLLQEFLIDHIDGQRLREAQTTTTKKCTHDH